MNFERVLGIMQMHSLFTHVFYDKNNFSISKLINIQGYFIVYKNIYIKFCG